MALFKSARQTCLLAAAVLIGLRYLPNAGAVVIATPVSPQCSGEGYRQLDFWLADWDTFDIKVANGSSVALARIESVAGGCALHGLYIENDGLVGDSLLNYDRAQKRWEQKLVTNRGMNSSLKGHFEGGVLQLEGEMTLEDGSTALQRISLEKIQKGVRQRCLLSYDGGKKWTEAFEVLYVKRAAE